MKSTFERLHEIQQRGFDLDLGTILNQAFENYKKVTLTIGTLILILIISFTFLIGGAAAITIGITNFAELLTSIDITEFSTIAVILNFLVAAIGTALVAPLTAGILKIVHSAQNNVQFSFATAFSYYNSSYFKNLFVATLVIALITNGIDAIANLLIENMEDEMLKNLLKLTIGIFNGLAGLFTLFTIPLIIFGQLKAMDAIKGSIAMVSKKFWTILLLLLIGAFSAITFGLLAFCIGIFFTLPFMYSLQYTIYRNAMGIENEEKAI